MAPADLLARRRPLHPTRLVVAGFSLLIALGTLLLLLPVATTDGRETSLVDALFTATSSVCVTGLVVVDTGAHWTAFGTVVIAALIQVGGFGIMTLGTLAALVLSGRLGLRQRVFTTTETGSGSLGQVRRLVRVVAVITVIVESVVAVGLGIGFWRSTDLSLLRSLGYGAFHAISAFNNAGFALFADSLERFVADWWISGIVAGAVILGGLGFPVLLELAERRSPRRWSLHTRVMLLATAALLIAGAVLITAFEWNNPGTIGALGFEDKLLAGSFASAMPRTAGFNSVPIGDMEEATLFVNDGLMFIGGGPASTAGGIKVSTFALLGFVMWAELRGEQDVTMFRRRLSTPIQRQALTIALAGIAIVGIATLTLMELSALRLSDALFETVSAFGTVGLSTGVTPDLDTSPRLVLVLLMFIGRVGPLTFGTALVLRSRRRRYRLPEEGVLIG